MKRKLFQVFEIQGKESWPCSIPLPINTGYSDPRLDADHALKSFRSNCEDRKFELREIDQEKWLEEFRARNKRFLLRNPEFNPIDFSWMDVFAPVEQ